ncbi:MAG: helix-turn-helix transcriptional regulator [Bacilli bacterium]
MKFSLKDLRKKHGYTQEEVALKLGYSSKSGYSMLENGKVNLSISKAKMLSELYEIDIKKIL